MRVQTHAQAHAPTHPRTHAHMEVHQHTHTLTQELLDLYDMIEHTKKMGIRYVGNEVTDIFPGASAERQGVQPGWQIVVVCCMVHAAYLMHVPDACCTPVACCMPDACCMSDACILHNFCLSHASGMVDVGC